MIKTLLGSSLKDENKGIVFSLTAHVVLVLFLILKNVFFESDAVDYQSAIRVDMIALPDKNPALPDIAPPPANTSETAHNEPPRELPAKPEPESLPEKKPIIDETAIKLSENKKAEIEKQKKLEEKKRKEALDRIKKMSALESIKSSVESERIEKLVGHAETHAKPSYKGNVLSAGSELTGINKIQHENYVALLDRQIRENWTLPQWLANKDFKAQALLKVDANGQVIYNQIYKSSGNPNYDDTVLETIRKSGPFPKPPEKFSAILSERGVLIGFPE
ncbi:MAG: cell envelope integrity protein TolA [Bdellovibrionaceae bacterium]|nr:cell envelope integrity protein TolA [Pseudobdellovibrionaceae bacterium]